MKDKINFMVALTVAITFSLSPVALADDASLVARLNSLEKTMTQMQRVIDTQNTKIMALEAPKRDEGDYVGPPVEVPSWLDGLKFSGDLRLRYEALQESSGCGPTAGPNTCIGRKTPDRNRFRFRLRYGMEKTWKGAPFHEDDVMKVGFRLASQVPLNAGGVTSTNTTLDTQFTGKSISINRAYATYLPGWATFTNDNGIGITGIEVTAGKFKNPLKQGSTWGIWDGDVEPEGMYQQINTALLKTEDLDISNKTILSQFILEEGGAVDHDDAELFAYQTIFESKIKGVMEKPIKLKNAVSWYKWEDYATKAGNFLAAGNNTLSTTGTGGLATSFNVINIYNEIAVPVSIHKAKGAKLYFDWFKNVDGNGIESEVDGDRDNAWMIGAKLGKAKKKGTWELKYEYAWHEQNATPDAFNDGDFGGTDRRGSIVRAKYALTDYMSVGLSAFFTNRISADSTVIDAERDLYQLDLVWKF